MKKIFAVVMLCSSLMCATLYAAEMDAAGCKDQPLFPRMTGYYIAGCDDHPANADMVISKGENTETIHIEGKSTALMYSPQPELKAKPSEAQLKNDFENAVKLVGGELLGKTFGQEWPFYHFVKDGKEFWVLLMVDSGKYYTGSYAFRIVEK